MKRKTPNGWWNQRAQQRQGPTIGDYLLRIAALATETFGVVRAWLLAMFSLKMHAGKLATRPASARIATLADAGSILAAAAARGGSAAI